MQQSLYSGSASAEVTPLSLFLVTERHLWSFRALTVLVSFCLMLHLPAYADYGAWHDLGCGVLLPSLPSTVACFVRPRMGASLFTITFIIDVPW